MTAEVLTHHIQRYLFKRLTGADVLRYSQLKPKDLEPNLFMYHLKELIKSGYVQKVENGYALTENGQLLASRFSMREVNIRQMPSTLTILLLHADDGEVLINERARHPYIGTYGAPSGKIHMGETLQQAAERELAEKTAYSSDAVSLKLRGDFSLVMGEGNAIENHVIGHIWEGHVGSNKKEHTHSAGRTFWADWNKLSYDKFILGYKEIYQACTTRKGQFTLDLKF
jgi:8-oxo-dGTP pyrophosphatase MutT (NUDIX family)